MPIPEYSLLKKHEDTVTYRIPDPRTNGWAEVGIYHWKLEDNNTTEDGIGLRFKPHRPTHTHPTPKVYKDIVSATFETFSVGVGQEGHTFRLEEGSPDELRQMGRYLVLYTFAYWWWIEEHSDCLLDKKGTREEMSPQSPDDVLEGGSVIVDGDVFESGYTLDQLDLLSPDEWTTPQEEAVNALHGTIDELDAPLYEIRKAIWEVEDEIEFPTRELTEARKEQDEFEAFLSELTEIDGIGRETKMQFKVKFDSVGGVDLGELDMYTVDRNEDKIRELLGDYGY